MTLMHNPFPGDGETPAVRGELLSPQTFPFLAEVTLLSGKPWAELALPVDSCVTLGKPLPSRGGLLPQVANARREEVCRAARGMTLCLQPQLPTVSEMVQVPLPQCVSPG